MRPAPGEPRREYVFQRRTRENNAAALQAAEELSTRQLQPVADGQGRAAEPPGGLGEVQALDVAEEDSQPERPRQALDLVVNGLGLLEVAG